MKWREIEKEELVCEIKESNSMPSIYYQYEETDSQSGFY